MYLSTIMVITKFRLLRKFCFYNSICLVLLSMDAVLVNKHAGNVSDSDAGGYAEFCSPYIDDIDYVRKLFERLCKHRLTANPMKCMWGATE